MLITRPLVRKLDLILVAVSCFQAKISCLVRYGFGADRKAHQRNLRLNLRVMIHGGRTRRKGFSALDSYFRDGKYKIANRENAVKTMEKKIQKTVEAVLSVMGKGKPERGRGEVGDTMDPAMPIWFEVQRQGQVQIMINLKKSRSW